MIMNNKALLIPFLALCLFAGQGSSTAQEYKTPTVTISKEKIKSNGVQYYSHVVLDKQTLYSISKAYGVSLEEIYNANPTLNLEKDGLKKNQIILIPDKGSLPETVEETADPVETEPVQQEEKKSFFARIGDKVKAAAKDVSDDVKETAQEIKSDMTKDADIDGPEYITHTVKWYEDLESISLKYKVSEDVLIKYNGLESNKLKKRQILKIPKNPDAVDITSVPTSTEAEPASVEVAPASKPEIKYRYEDTHPKTSLKAAVLLPLNAGKEVINDSNYDFYSGVLMAVRDLADQGKNVTLEVYDISNPGTVATEEIYASNDIVLGPVTSDEIHKALEICPPDKFVISPLDPKAVSIASGAYNFIQAPSSVESQYNEIVNWIKEDTRNGDKLIVISEKSGAVTPIASMIEDSGMEHERLSYGILEGRDITALLQKIMSPTAANRVVISSDSEAFVNDVVRNLNIMAFEKYNVVLYGPSRIRTYETIEVENFHGTNLHVASSYYVDYDDAKVKNFLMSYRAFFKTEPSPFAYQGYDTAYYFLSRCSDGPDRWSHSLLNGKKKGLQSDFMFIKEDGGGYVNQAVRRIVYGPDYSVSVIN